MTPGALYVGGDFTDAGGIPAADRIATWNGSSWTAVSSSASQISNGGVSAIAVSGGRVFVGGTFQNAGGNANADFLAVWDGASWAPFCTSSGPAFDGTVNSLLIVGQTLYVGGALQDGANIPSPDYLLACDLPGGAPHTTVVDTTHPFAGTHLACHGRGRRRVRLRGHHVRPRCTSPKTFAKLAPGKHVFRVKARDRAGNVDRTPTVKRFTIKKR